MVYKYDRLDMKAVGSFLKTARKAKGHTQQSLADALTVDSKYISQIERGVGNPSYALMVAISDELGVGLDFLTRGADDSQTAIEKETLFYIPEAKGLTKSDYNFIQKSIRDMVKNLKSRKV